MEASPEYNEIGKKAGEQKDIPLLNLRRGFEQVEEDIKKEWNHIFQDMNLFNGENLRRFEDRFAGFIGTRHAYGVASGTDALTLGLAACRIGPEDEVILQANGFVAAVEAIRILQAKPILVDIEDGNFGPDLSQIEKRISDKTKGVIVVHMYGHPVGLDPISETCSRHRLKLIEDCSHAHGAGFNGRNVGSFGQVGCFSCGVVKNLNAYGDAGVVTTSDDSVANRLNYLRVHGQVKKNDHLFYGFNSRLDELQAAVLKIKLGKLEEKNERRRFIAKRYREALADIGEIRLPPQDDAGSLSVYHQFVVRTDKRTFLMRHLKSCGIGCGIHYPVPLHLQPAWNSNGLGTYRLPRVESLSQEILSIPIYPELKEDEIEYIIENIRSFFMKK